MHVRLSLRKWITIYSSTFYARWSNPLHPSQNRINQIYTQTLCAVVNQHLFGHQYWMYFYWSTLRWFVHFQCYADILKVFWGHKVVLVFSICILPYNVTDKCASPIHILTYFQPNCRIISNKFNILLKKIQYTHKLFSHLTINTYEFPVSAPASYRGFPMSGSLNSYSGTTFILIFNKRSLKWTMPG